MNALLHVVTERSIHSLMLPNAGEPSKSWCHNDHAEMVMGTGGVDHLNLCVRKRDGEFGFDFFGGDHDIAVESGHGRSAIAI